MIIRKYLEFLLHIKLTSYVGLTLALMFVSTVLLSIFASNEAAKLVDMERKISQYEQESREISTEIIAKSSLKQLSNNASGLGLTASQKVLYFNSDVSVAQIR